METALTLSPRAQAALAVIGSPSDLQLRATLRHDVQVCTSLIVLRGDYESIVLAPPDVRDAMTAHGVSDARRYATKADAERGHEALCGRVQAVLDAMQERG